MATEAIVSAVLEQLTSIIGREIQQRVRLVMGVSKEVKKLTSNFQAIQAVLVDAEQRQVKETTVRVWLDKLKSVSYDVDDILDEWNTAILKLQIEGVENTLIPKKKVCFVFPSSCFRFKQVALRHDIALKIKEINENLDSIAKEKDMYHLNTIRSFEQPQRLESTSFIDISKICGREVEKNTLLSKLLCESSEGQDLPIISLVGMGGIGKTTLAQLAYNDREVMEKFKTRIWVCVSDPFDELRVANTILEGLIGVSSKSIGLQSVLQDINRSIDGKKFLLVLDDLWTDDYNRWEPMYTCLKNSVYGSKILVTTRKETVAHMLGSTIVHVTELSKEACWSLFTQLAFSGRSHEERENLEKVGREIVGKCKGLPLAAKIIGSFLRLKRTREDWKNILDSELWKLEFEKGIFPPLLLSYNDLPFMVKQCFLYCAIFPKDDLIEKDELIRLWMAQDYLKSEQNQEMEIIGREYFDNLSTRSFFQEFEKDEDGNIKHCKMHDMVHDFAQFLTKNEFIAIEVYDNLEPIRTLYEEKARHSNLIFHEGASFPNSFYSLKKLRSLLVSNECGDDFRIDNVLPKLFDELTCLRTLDMCGSPYDLIEKIPNEIGKLIHLRYLNLSYVSIKELPETLCQLYNLQTLDVNWSRTLEKLPQGMGKLVNLRHLVNRGNEYSLKYMPQGIERLENLRTLELLVVADGGEDSTASACSIGCLQHLNNLRGALSIWWRGNATDLNGARKAQLKKKESLSHLELTFKIDRNNEEEEEEEKRMLSRRDNEEFLEALQPSPNLEYLRIRLYKGTVFPEWMISLSNLKKLEFRLCNNCERLPPLGKLPYLESLDILEMRSLKRVSNEFLGIDSSSLIDIAFPKLRSLKFYDMYGWEEWDGESITNKGEEEDADIAIMPNLSTLKVYSCPALKALPNYIVQSTSLKELIISRNCKMLVDHYSRETGEDRHKISPNIEFHY